MDIKKVVEFAQEHGYETAEPLGSWQGYDIYEPVYSKDEVSCIGLPLMIMVKGNEIRMSTTDEAIQQIDDLEE